MPIHALCSPQDAEDEESRDLLQHISADRSPDGVFADEAVGNNPAAKFYQRDFSISGFSLRGDYLHRDEPLVVQTGTGHMLGNVEATSYMRLSKGAVVWGSAQFCSGTYRDIKWNNSGDYDLVGPYVVADSVGGELATRRYSFAGGYAGESNGWTWGAHVSYLAAIDYRNRDPRDKIVVSDLAIRLGVSRKLFSDYAISMGGDIRVYNQESDVTFYNPNNEIRTYALIGLGNYNPRFSGNTNNSTAYNAFGIGGQIGLFNTARQGGYVNASFHYLPMKQILRNFNNLELTRAGNYFMTANIGYKLCAGQITVTPGLKGHFRRQLGFENLYGSAVGNNYLYIGRRRNYYHDRLAVNLDIPVSITFSDRFRFDITPGATMGYDRENYRKPVRNLSVTTYTPQLTAAGEWRASSKLLLSLKLTGCHSFVPHTSADLTGLNLSSIMGTSVEHNFAMLSSRITAGGGAIGADLKINPTMALHLEARCHSTHYPGHGNAIASELTAGLKF